jgi:hypothetical protein
LIAEIRPKEDPEELVRACFNRINDVNPRLNDVVELSAEAALVMPDI